VPDTFLLGLHISLAPRTWRKRCFFVCFVFC